ncbi:hypothetical protein AB4Y43_24610 [Paraburkholderia sp. BR10872]|uniref:hypothetical protein n=1 Tax=Paraburkholderia sp. BR10872 TaxID=3236989 RepID=UPI0034D341D1
MPSDAQALIDPGDLPDFWLYGYPGQDLVWPGEFVLGYPVSGVDPLIPGPTLSCEPWMRNGSFLVYRVHAVLAATI